MNPLIMKIISCFYRSFVSFPNPLRLSGAALSCIAYPWWSTRSTARVHPASTRHPSGETPPGIGCQLLLEHRCPEARPRRALTACSASRSSSSTRQQSHEAPPLIGNCLMGPGKPLLTISLLILCVAVGGWSLSQLTA